MPVIYFSPEKGSETTSASEEVETNTYPLKEGESVLDCLLRNDHSIPFGCKSGVCQSCLMVSKDAGIPAVAQAGLSAAQKEQGYFLSCSCRPDEDLHVSMGTFAEKVKAKVLNKDALSASIYRLRLQAELEYSPGQFATLWKDANIARSYSIASQASEPFLEFHIKRIPGGAFSDWAWRNVQPGDVIDVQGPMGNCYYTKEASTKELFLAGIGTGLAPLYGIARNALQAGHNFPIHFLVGSKSESGLYYQEELMSLMKEYSHFHCYFVLQEKDQDIYQFVKDNFESFAQMQVYLCGAASFVRKMKKQCFLAGAAMKDIISDPFIPFVN